MTLLTLSDEEKKTLVYLFRELLKAPMSTEKKRFFDCCDDKGLFIVVDNEEAQNLGSILTRIEANVLYSPTNQQS